MKRTLYNLNIDERRNKIRILYNEENHSFTIESLNKEKTGDKQSKIKYSEPLNKEVIDLNLNKNKQNLFVPKTNNELYKNHYNNLLSLKNKEIESSSTIKDYYFNLEKLKQKDHDNMLKLQEDLLSSINSKINLIKKEINSFSHNDIKYRILNNEISKKLEPKYNYFKQLLILTYLKNI